MSTEMVECARREALFVSVVQPSDAVSADDVRVAVGAAVRRHGTRGCAALVAYEFGEHPEAAAARMRWVCETVVAAFPPRRGLRTGQLLCTRRTVLPRAA